MGYTLHLTRFSITASIRFGRVAVVAGGDAAFLEWEA